MFKEWMGTTRYVYNRALHALKTDGVSKYNFMALRNRFVTHKRRTGEINTEVKEWELETPKDVRAECLRDLTKAFSVAIINLKRGNIQRFSMRYRKKKSFPSIVIPKTALSIKDGGLNMFKRYTKKNIRLCKDKTLQHLKFDYDCRLQCKHGQWYLIVPIKVVAKKKKQKKGGIASLDPGVCTFQTIYSETHVIKIQQNTELLKKLHSKLDSFQSLRAKKNISRSHYTRRIRRLYKRMDCLIDELHFKTINVLKEHYKWILLPSFESQEMAKRNSNKKCNRNMMQLKHYLFKERLKASCMLDKTTDVTIVHEDYTSKTCTQCGKIKSNLGGSRVFNCDHCNLRCDRDVNGARNILLKYITSL